MNKCISLALAGVFALGLVPASLTMKRAAAEAWEPNAAEAAKWETSTSGGSATVTLSAQSGEPDMLTVEVDKEGRAFGGVETELKEAIAAEAETRGYLIGLSFEIENKKALSEGNIFTIRLGLAEDETWTVAAEDTTSGKLPNLTKAETTEIEIPFDYLPQEVKPEDIETLTLGVEGEEDASFAVSDISLLYSDEKPADPVRTEVPAAAIGDITFTTFQYGGAEGTTAKQDKVTETQKSKESAGGALHATVSGTGATASRIYSFYFPTPNAVASLNLTSPQAVSFWVYNDVAQTGGLLFKANSKEVKTGIKVFGEDGEEMPEKANNRNLDYTGFRKYEIALDAAQFGTNLEIGFWGCTSDLSAYLSSFSIIDLARPVVGAVSLGKITDLKFTNYSTKGIMQKLEGTNATYSHEEGEAYIGISRTASASGSDFSSVYMQTFSQVISGSGAINPTSISFYLYNAKAMASGGGLMFKFGATERTNVRWENENGESGTDRNLNYTGLRKYTIPLTAADIAQNEFQLGIWGTPEAELYFSDFEVYDASAPLVNVPGKTVLVEANAENYTKLEAAHEAALTAGEDALVFTAKGNAYMERSLEGLFTEADGSLTFSVQPGAAYGENALEVYVLYDDGSKVPALCLATKVSFTDTSEKDVTVNLATLPYYVTPANVTGLRLSFAIDGDYTASVSGLAVQAATAQKEIYSHLVSGFESVSDVVRWRISQASGTQAKMEPTGHAKVGTGALSYRFENVLYDFGWTEIYIDIGDLMELNGDKDIKGMSFWLYNTTYVEPGELGFWVKVAQSDSAEFEVKFDSVVTEKGTNNNLGFVGWNKVEIPFSADAYTEQTYYSGYDASHPRSFDWTKLKYIKIGFWGTYYNNTLGYSCDTVIDDVRLLSTRPLEADTPIGGEGQYTITYHLNGGTLSNPKETYTAGEAFTLPVPTRSGYKFIGWYTNEGLTGDPVTEVKADSASNLTFYAAWEEGTENPFPVGLVVGIAAGVAAVGTAVGVTIGIVRKKKRKS